MEVYDIRQSESGQEGSQQTPIQREEKGRFVSTLQKASGSRRSLLFKLQHQSIGENKEEKCGMPSAVYSKKNRARSLCRLWKATRSRRTILFFVLTEAQRKNPATGKRKYEHVPRLSHTSTHKAFRGKTSLHSLRLRCLWGIGTEPQKRGRNMGITAFTTSLENFSEDSRWHIESRVLRGHMYGMQQNSLCRKKDGPHMEGQIPRIVLKEDWK